MIFNTLFNKIWETVMSTSDWENGVIDKIPKKGDLECSNWVGITAWAIAFCKVLHNRIEPVVDVLLKDEQSRFRRGRGCGDQIFITKHLTQLANKMKTIKSLFCGFRKGI